MSLVAPRTAKAARGWGKGNYALLKAFGFSVMLDRNGRVSLKYRSGFFVFMDVVWVHVKKGSRQTSSHLDSKTLYNKSYGWIWFMLPAHIITIAKNRKEIQAHNLIVNYSFFRLFINPSVSSQILYKPLL